MGHIRFIPLAFDLDLMHIGVLILSYGNYSFIWASAIMGSY
jgi:hypothetical protein